MNRRRTAIRMLAAALAVATIPVTAPAVAQVWPSKPIGRIAARRWLACSGLTAQIAMPSATCATPSPACAVPSATIARYRPFC